MVLLHFPGVAPPFPSLPPSPPPGSGIHAGLVEWGWVGGGEWEERRKEAE